MGMEIYAVRISAELKNSTARGHHSASHRTMPHFGLFQLPFDPVHVIFIHYITNIENCNRNHIEIP